MESEDTTNAISEETLTTRAVKLSVYVVIFTVGLIGNSLVCLVVCRQRRLRTSTNYFILNLACADLAVIIICIPFDVAVQENGYVWPFGNILCRIIYPFMTTLTFASVGTLTAIALNRHEAISHPMRINAVSKKGARLVIACVWGISAAISLPYMAALKLNEKSQCHETWPKMYSRIYTVFIVVFQYLLPLSIITAAYIRIWMHLRQNRANMTAAQRAQDQDVFKVVRMMIVVVLVFAFCLLPNQILWLFKDFHPRSDPMEDELLSWGAILIYANSCTNPIVYSICVEEFRVAFKAYIFKCHKVTEEDVVGVGRLFERLSIRRGRPFSSVNSRNPQVREDRATQQHSAVSLAPTTSCIKNGLVQKPTENMSRLPTAEHSGLGKRYSGRSSKEENTGLASTKV